MEFDDIKSPKELLEYMDKNLTYGFVGKDGKRYTNANSNDWINQYVIQNGEQVLKSKIGTCYDQVELERLWFEKNNYNFKTIFAWFEVGRENGYPTHTFLIYEDNNKYYWFEHAWIDLKGIHEFNSYEEAIECFCEKHFEFTKLNHEDLLEDDKNRLVCYEYTKPDENLDVEEYFSFVTSDKKENIL